MIDALNMARRNHHLQPDAGDALLDSYGTERKDHVEHYINFAVDLGRIICITDEQEAAERDEKMKAELAAKDDDTPMNTDIGILGPGICVEGDPHVGELAHQGVLEHEGKIGRFDDVVGRGWILIGLDRDPWEVLTDEQRTGLERLAAISVRVGPEGSGAGAIDTDGVLAAWLSDIDSTYVVLRPDFYVAATASDEEHLRRSLGTVLERLHLTEGERVEA